MNKTLFLKDLKRNFKKFLIWMVVIIGFNLITMAIYPSIAGDMEALASFMEFYPEQIAKALGMNAISWSTPLGFYTTYFTFYVLMCGGMYAVGLGSTLIAREEGAKTADFLLAKPMTRGEIVISKLLVFSIYIFLLNILAYLSTIILFSIVTDNFDVGRFTILSVYGFLYTYMFGMLAMFISVLIRRGRALAGAMTGAVIGAYFIDMLSKVSEKSKVIGYIAPNRFVNTDVTAAEYGFRTGEVIYFLVFIAAFAASVFFIYRKKDIYV